MFSGVGKTVPEIEAGKWCRCSLVEPATPEPCLFEPIERARQIDRADQWHGVERAGGSLGQCAGCRRRAVLSDNDGIGAERRRRAQDRTDIVRIADLVEHDDDRAAWCHLGSAQHILEVGAVERFDFERPSLVDSALG